MSNIMYLVEIIPGEPCVARARYIITEFKKIMFNIGFPQ